MQTNRTFNSQLRIQMIEYEFHIYSSAMIYNFMHRKPEKSRFKKITYEVLLTHSKTDEINV